MAGAHTRLARRRSDELRGSRRSRAPLGSRLSGRRAMERRRGGEDLVRANQVAALVSSDPGRDAGGHSAVRDLRRSRLLSDPSALKAALANAAHQHGFDVVGITRPDSTPQSLERLRHFLAEGAHGDMDWMETTAVRRGRPPAPRPHRHPTIILGLDHRPQPANEPPAPLGSDRAAPTSVFRAPYRLDARRCISYLTIEHKGPIPRELRSAIGNRIFGCDDCLAVCPWNKFAQAGRESKLAAREELTAPRLAELARLDDTAFRKMFSKSPVKRTGRNRFVRNALIAIGNSGDAALAPEAIQLLDDPSALVRGAAVWALSRLMPPKPFAALARDRRPHESEPLVAAEWTAALARTAA